MSGGSAREDRTDVFSVTAGVSIDGRYRIVERIGAGGMGSVFRVQHERLGTDFALKLLRQELSEDERMRQRFEREARAAARVVSEHVVPIVDFGALPDGTPYFVMQLLEGKDLRALLRECGPLPPVRAVNLLIDACRGLHAAHAAGLVHRDLKPANLFVTRGDDGRDVVKLLDFGVVKHTDEVTTQPGALVGTARYMAPEQIGADYRVGPHTDLFALGVILYECLAGEAPFTGDTTERVLYAIMTGEPKPLTERCQGLPDGLSQLVARAVEKPPDQRFASATEFAAALLPFAGARGVFDGSEAGATNATDTTGVDGTFRAQHTPKPTLLPAEPRRSWWLAPAAIGALVTSGFAFMLGRSQRSEPVTPESVPANAPTLESSDGAATASAVSTASTAPTPPSPLPSARPAPPPDSNPLSSASGIRPVSSPTPRLPAPSRVEAARRRALDTAPTPSGASAAPTPKPPPTGLDPRNPYD